jgi:hypothetical protein
VKLNGTSVAAPQVVRFVANTFDDHTTKDLPGLLRLRPQNPDDPPPQRAAVGVPDQEVFPTPDDADKSRLGSGVIHRQLSRRVPRRRYPGEFRVDPDDDMTN